MKKNFKRTLAKVMAAALTVSLLGTAGDADAAKKIKLAKKSITVTKGKSKKVAIKNVKAKKVKKLTVKSSKKKIATVKKSGKTAIKVTGKKKGTAKITVKVTVKGKKKATTLKLTVKVKNKKAGGGSGSGSTTPGASKAPAASAAAPAASAGVQQPQPSTGTQPQPSTGVQPQPSADQSAAPQPSADQSAAPQPSVEPTATPEPSYDPALEDVNIAMTEANMPAWATSANGGYGQVTFNADGSIDYSSQPTAIDPETNEVKVGSCYNNGFAFYIDPAKEKKDMSMYHYVVIKIKTDAEVAPITWSGGGDPESFWDKKDVWGKQINVIENADGSKTMVYPVSELFGKPAKASTIGVTLKSCQKGADGKDDDTTFLEKTGTIYGIYFTNTMPGEGGDNPTPSASADVDDNVVSFDLTKTSEKMGADVVPVAAEDGEGVVMPYTKKYQSVFYDIPADVNLAQVKEIKITADIPKDGQLSFTLYNKNFSKEVDNWWDSKNPAIVYATYPFWQGSYTERTEDGAPVEGKKGIETQTIAIKEVVKAEDMWKAAGDGGYFSIGSNQFVEDAQYKVLKVEFVLDKTIDPVKDIVEPAPKPTAPAPTATATVNPVTTPTAPAPTATATAEPVTTPDVDTSVVESGDVESGDVESGKVDTEATETAAPTATPEATATPEPTPITLEGAALGANAEYTQAGVGDGKYKAVLSVDVSSLAADLVENAAIVVTFDELATNKDLKLVLLNGTDNLDTVSYNGATVSNGDTTATITVNKTEADAITALSDKSGLTLALQTTVDETKVTGAHISGITVGGADKTSGLTLPDKYAYENKASAYAQLAKVSLKDYKDQLVEGAKVDVTFETDDAAAKFNADIRLDSDKYTDQITKYNQSGGTVSFTVTAAAAAKYAADTAPYLVLMASNQGLLSADKKVTITKIVITQPEK